MGISRINLDITYKCNANCIHCSRNSNSGDVAELSVNEWLKVIENSFSILPKKGASYILQGGEPTISPAFFPISKRIREVYKSEAEPYLSADHALQLWKSSRNMLSFATNGILLSKLQKDFELIGFENIRVSIDGASSKINDSIRIGVKLDLLKKSLKKASKKLPLQIGFVVLKQNMNEAVKVIELASKLGIYSVRLTPFFPIGRGKNIASEVLSGEDYTKLTSSVLTKVSELRNPPFISLGCPEPYAQLVINDLGIKLDKRNICNGLPVCLSVHKCYAFSDEVTISPDGFVTGCCYMSILDDFRAGNLRNKSLNQILESKEYIELLKLKEQSILSSYCVDCERKSLCDGKCMIFAKAEPSLYCDKL